MWDLDVGKGEETARDQWAAAERAAIDEVDRLVTQLSSGGVRRADQLAGSPDIVYFVLEVPGGSASSVVAGVSVDVVRLATALFLRRHMRMARELVAAQAALRAMAAAPQGSGSPTRLDDPTDDVEAIREPGVNPGPWDAMGLEKRVAAEAQAAVSTWDHRAEEGMVQRLNALERMAQAAQVTHADHFRADEAHRQRMDAIEGRLDTLVNAIAAVRLAYIAGRTSTQ